MRQQHDPSTVTAAPLGDRPGERRRAEGHRQGNPGIVNEAADFATHDPEPDAAELYTDVLE